MIKKITLLLTCFVCMYQSYAQSTTSQTLNVVSDTYTRGGTYSGDNYGGEIELIAKAGSTNNFLRNTYLQFDLSDFETISSATLQVYGSAQQTMNLSAYATATDNWSETALTWDTAPTKGSLLGATAITSTDAWLEINVTSHAQTKVTTALQLMSIQLGDAEALNKTITLKSKEADSGLYQAKLVVAGVLKTPTEEPPVVINENQIDVYLVIGQSNTAGRGAIEAQDEEVLDHVYLLNDAAQWENASNPLNAYSTIRKDLSEQGLGYAYTFSKKIQEVTGNDVGLVVNARGGSSIFSWRKDDADAYFTEALTRLQAALALPNTTFKGILWHQGEANRNYAYYLSTLSTFINDWREAVDMPELAFVAGQLSQLREDNATFNTNILTLPNLVTNTGVATSENLNAPDLTHFDAAGQRLLGERYADIILELVYNITDTYEGNYYIDSENGDDANSGYSPATPWKTLANINTTTFVPGDQILFKAGGEWTGVMMPTGSGTEESPIIIDKYGSGANPIIHGDSSQNCSINPSSTIYCTLHLANQEYWEVNNLEITNYNSTEEAGLSLEAWEERNITDYAAVVMPPQYTGTNTNKCGILIEANDFGEVNHIKFSNLEIHGINGNIHDKDNGGIFIEVYNFGSETPTYFKNISIDQCHIHDVDRTGISNVSAYDTRLLTSNTDWTPNQEVTVTNTTFERTGANALILRVADGPLVENCLFDHCAIKESGNAAFFFNVDNGIMQYNEFRYTKANTNDNDAGGPDIDFRTKNCILQYNYLHDNDFGLLVTGGSDPTSGRFNDNGIVRYNIIERDGKYPHPSDGKFILKTSGNTTGTKFYNNVIYLDDTQSDTKIAWNKKWGGASADETYYHNNIIYNLGTNTYHDYNDSTNNTMSHNLYYGNDVALANGETDKFIGNPLFLAVGNGTDGYQIQDNSPAIGMGITMPSIPELDYFSNAIPSPCESIDIGVHQFGDCSNETLSTGNNIEIIKLNSYTFTNPVTNGVLTLKNITSPITSIELIDLFGRVVKVKEITNENTLDLSGVSKGIYLIKIVNDQTNTIKKLVIQ